MMHDWSEGWHMGGMWLWWVIGIAAFVAAAWLIARRRAAANVRAPESPEEALKRGYAAGEMEDDEYERKLAQLRK